MSDHVLERLSAWLDGELPALERGAVEAHLRTCAACAGQLEVLRAVDAGARGLPLSVPPGYFDELPGRVRARLERAPRPRTARLPVWTWAVAAVFLLAVVTPLTLRRAPAPAAEGLAVAPREAPGKVALERFPAARDDAEQTLRKQPAANRADRPEPPGTLSSALLEEEDLKAEAPKLQDARPAEAERAGASAPVASAPARRPAPGGPSAQQQAPLQVAGASAYAPPPAAAPAEADALSSGSLESRVASRDEAQGRREKSAGGTGRMRSGPASSGEASFQRLTTAVSRTLPGLRERREAWREFSHEFPNGPRADEARVRVIETGAEAWRVGADPIDLARVREDAAGYLARGDAAQAARVRAVLESLPPPTP